MVGSLLSLDLFSEYSGISVDYSLRFVVTSTFSLFLLVAAFTVPFYTLVVSSIKVFSSFYDVSVFPSVSSGCFLDVEWSTFSSLGVLSCYSSLLSSFETLDRGGPLVAPRERVVGVAIVTTVDVCSFKWLVVTWGSTGVADIRVEVEGVAYVFTFFYFLSYVWFPFPKPSTVHSDHAT